MEGRIDNLLAELGAAPAGSAAAPGAAGAAESLPFARSAALTLGVELELGIVDPASMDLTPAAPILVAALARDGFGQRVKAELTDAMIELNTSVHASVATLRTELERLVRTLNAYAQRFGLLIVGGGTHPFQNWANRTIYPSQRFHEISRRYGYMAQQFTVFGQHVHVGCTNGDDAMYLTHAFARYTPHLIALSACSPYWRGIDTGFDCCRLNVVNAFPLSGLAPACRTWADFERFYTLMRRRAVVASMKDFYWDIRPKPEFGTVEIRVFDTPLRPIEAVDTAALVQALAAELLERPRRWPDEYFGYLYARNRFQAGRFGFDGEYIDADENRTVLLGDSLHELLRTLAPRFAALRAMDSHERLCGRVAARRNGAGVLRERYRELGSHQRLVLEMSSSMREAA